MRSLMRERCPCTQHESHRVWRRLLIPTSYTPDLDAFLNMVVVLVLLQASLFKP